MHKELERGWNLFNEGKDQKALESLANLEKVEDLNPDDQHYCRFLKGTIFYHIGRLPESLKIAAEDHQESRNQNKPLFLIDSIFLKWIIMLLLGRALKLWEDVVLCEKLLQSASQEPSYEVKLREGIFHYMKGYYCFWERKYDKAIENHKKSLVIFKNYDLSLSMIPHNLNVLGGSYTAKGELDLALKYNK